MWCVNFPVSAMFVEKRQGRISLYTEPNWNFLNHLLEKVFNEIREMLFDWVMLTIINRAYKAATVWH